MNWEAVTALATVLTGCVILATVIVGVYQLAQLREQRRDTAAIELMRSLQDTTFARAFLSVASLPPNSSPDTWADSHLEEAAQILAFRFEALGLMVYRGAVHLAPA